MVFSAAEEVPMSVVCVTDPPVAMDDQRAPSTPGKKEPTSDGEAVHTEQVTGSSRGSKRKRTRGDATSTAVATPEKKEPTHSFLDTLDLADLEDASAQQLQEYPHALKSFHQWMLAGATKKSGLNYTHMICLLMRCHGKSIEAMTSERYYEWVKASRENRARNNILSAALKSFQAFLMFRDSTTAPWEEHALESETPYLLERRSKSRKQDSEPPRPEAETPPAKKPSPLLALFSKQLSRHGRFKLSAEQLQRIEENRRQALRRRQEVGAKIGNGSMTLPAVSTNVASTPTRSPSTLTPEQLARIETNRREALLRRERRFQQIAAPGVATSHHAS
eukprot:CAMPEP_0117502296 /NCGR_PEP_ID=MMETSP0784-20121206/23740_1 /TAXON_ID=39447 /ORGANISM="" /LENGTH=333 /DNA_ID=CAMNT_0005297575 /DNA_START=66 /DNA_END=1067 /DNA_ORIENTATION=+